MKTFNLRCRGALPLVCLSAAILLTSSCTDERQPLPSPGVSAPDEAAPPATPAVDAAPLSWQEAADAASARRDVRAAFGDRQRACTRDEQCGRSAVCDKKCGEVRGRCVRLPAYCGPSSLRGAQCGCDGVTYGSQCERLRAGVALAHDGRCRPGCNESQGLECPGDAVCIYPIGTCEVRARAGFCVDPPDACPNEARAPVCGCDGVTYPNWCELVRAGVSADHPGECARVCDGLLGTPCDDGEFCEHPAGTCDLADGQGICEDTPGACTREYAPVCGCDGATYSNDCERRRAGVSLDHRGACEPPPCETNADCGGAAWCQKEACGDATGRCEPRPEACITVYMPVCSCDGVTYGNACFAAMDGANVAHDGRCEPSLCCNAEDEPGTNGLPACIEGASCCDDGLWRCNHGDGSPACGPRLGPAPTESAAPASADAFRADPGDADAETEPVVVPPGDPGGLGEVCEACCVGPPNLRCPEPITCCGDGHWTCGTCDVVGHECRDRACTEASDCRAGEFCKQAGCDTVGECVDRPVACPKNYAPVCGCDGVTYDNACMASEAGASVAHEGTCELTCGGIMGIPCPAGMQCDLPGGLCGGADFMGVCVDTPVVCPLYIDPVCGCDGVTYGNDCARLMAGAQLDHDGPCAPAHCCDPTSEPGYGGSPSLCRHGATCCADGTWRCDAADGTSTCGAASEPADPASSDVVTLPDGGGEGDVCEACCSGPAPMCANVQCCGDGSWSCGGCDVIGHACEVRTCQDNSDCHAANTYCAKASCEAAAGRCAPRPRACLDVYDPVCGCDGVTYGNACSAHAAGANVAHEGACSQVCGGLLGTPCPEGSYCDLPEGLCSGADFQGVCVEVGDVCITLWDPVCACDGTTYANDCYRIQARAQKDHDGACGPAHCCDAQATPTCFEGATCCPSGEWRCNDAAGQSTCGEVSFSSAAAEPAPPPPGAVCEACCDPAKRPGVGANRACATEPTCCGDGQWRCNEADGTPTCDVVGHACQPECPGVMCDLWCQWGFQTGPDGCEICACNPGPRSER